MIADNIELSSTSKNLAMVLCQEAFARAAFVREALVYRVLAK
jgi:hypothetical protein